MNNLRTQVFDRSCFFMLSCLAVSFPGLSLNVLSKFVIIDKFEPSQIPLSFQFLWNEPSKQTVRSNRKETVCEAFVIWWVGFEFFMNSIWMLVYITVNVQSVIIRASRIFVAWYRPFRWVSEMLLWLVSS